jgi:hypothetical protein
MIIRCGHGVEDKSQVGSHRLSKRASMSIEHSRCSNTHLSVVQITLDAWEASWPWPVALLDLESLPAWWCPRPTRSLL